MLFKHPSITFWPQILYAFLLVITHFSLRFSTRILFSFFIVWSLRASAVIQLSFYILRIYIEWTLFTILQEMYRVEFIIYITDYEKLKWNCQHCELNTTNPNIVWLKSNREVVLTSRMKIKPVRSVNIALFTKDFPQALASNTRKRPLWMHQSCNKSFSISILKSTD